MIYTRLIAQELKLLTIITLSIFMSSCYGQEKANSKLVSSNTTVNKTNKSAEFKDPLFYIEGQLCQHLREIFQDRNGDLWFGTNVYDLMLYNGDSLKYITEVDGFGSGRVTGFQEDKDRVLWIATGYGLNKYEGKSFTTYTKKDGLASDEIWSMVIDKNGTLWLGHNNGLSRFDGNTFENIAVPKTQVKEPNVLYSEDRIVAIVEDKLGNLWLGTDGYGLCKYDGEKFEHFTTDDGLCDNTISDLMLDSKGNLWVGTYWGGVSKYDGETFHNYTKDGKVSGVEVGAFFEDRNGDVWFGVENNGVYKYDGKSFFHYDKENGLDASILSIYRDKEERFWFGGWGGLFRFDGQSFMSVTKEGPWN